jgi:hypothetical protein
MPFSPLTLGGIFGSSKGMDSNTRRRSPIQVHKIINELRRERHLPRLATPANPTKITRAVLRQIAVDAWKKYPQSLTDPDYQLGELTLDLVNQEICQRIADLKRGVVIGRAALKDYFN